MSAKRADAMAGMEHLIINLLSRLRPNAAKGPRGHYDRSWIEKRHPQAHKYTHRRKFETAPGGGEKPGRDHCAPTTQTQNAMRPKG